MVRAARLEPALYEEVEADTGALGQATAVVVISSLAAGIAVMPAQGIGVAVTATLAAMVGWYLWAALTWFIGTRLLPEPQTSADFGQLLRTLGFSSAPGVIRIGAVVAPLAPIISLVASVWMLASMVVAVRQALDYTSTSRALGVCAIGFCVQLLLAALLLWPMRAL
jgi:hypothetical protein